MSNRLFPRMLHDMRAKLDAVDARLTLGRSHKDAIRERVTGRSYMKQATLYLDSAEDMARKGDWDIAWQTMSMATWTYAQGLEILVDEARRQAALGPLPPMGRSPAKERDKMLYREASALLEIDSDLSITDACRAAVASNTALGEQFGASAESDTLRKAFQRGGRDGN